MLKPQNYFRARNGQYYTAFTKDALYEIIDNNNPDSFLPILHILDYPYIKYEWNRLMDKYGNNAHILGRYCSVMRLKAYQVFRFDDSNELNAKSIDYLLERKMIYDSNEQARRRIACSGRQI